MKNLVFCLLLSGLLLGAAQGALAEEKTMAHVKGPAKVVLGNNVAIVDMPKGYLFVDEQSAKAFLREGGDSDEGVLGMIYPAQRGNEQQPEFLVICRFQDIGHVSDDDADKLNAKELLQQYKEGTAEGNEERKAKGIPPFYVGNWVENPHYDKGKHHVIWALEVKDQDSPQAPVVGINYNTRILGRNGVLSMNLVTAPELLERNKQDMAVLLADTSFSKGNSYSDYKPGVDKDAGFGIAGLVLGGGALAAAAKMGVLGGLWKWALGIILVLKKSIFLVIAGAGALIAKLFSKKKTANAALPDDHQQN